jgi:NHLM bacteriocin system ABC transporter peptidase/ATP-binding protein
MSASADTAAPRLRRAAALATRFVPRAVARRLARGEGGEKPPAPPPRPAKRVRVPTVLQMEAVECGAASLAMVLAYHGRTAPLEELRLACGVSRDGSKASNVLKAARAYGLVAKGFKKEPGDLKTIAGPMIVHWNFNHFVVLEGFRDGKAYLNDPASGPAAVSEAEFDQSFTGVVLTFERAPEFVRGGARPSLLRAVAARLPGSRASVAYVFLAGLALVVPGVVAPAFQKAFVDEVLVRGMSHWLKPLLLLMAAAALVNAGLVWLQQHYLLRLQTKLAVETSGKFLWHVLRLPVVFFTQRFAGDIGNRVSINDRVARLLAGDIATTALNVLVVAFYAVLLLRYDVVLTLVGVTTAALNIVALRVVSRRRADLSRRLLQDRGKMMGTAMNGLQIIETLKATGSESDFFGRWAGHQAKVGNAYQQLQLATTLLSAVPPLLLAVNTALVLGVGGVRVMDGHLSMGMLIAFQALMLAFVSPVNRMVDLASSLQEVKGDMARLDDVLGAARDPHAEDAPGAVGAAVAADAPVKLSGELELRGVCFGYSRLEPPLIENFDLTLRPGSRVALVGGSGCGKSTVAKLVSGLFEPWSGEILFDGRPRAAFPRATMANSLAVVDQDVAMFEGTIKDNVTLWDDTVPEADLVQAARDACIHDDVAARPGGYAGGIEEGGRNFSGGQRQRVEIARALVGNPTILVLDEATSALDPATEKVIDDNLRRRGCTCLIVAHRLSTIRDCDEILVLDRGKIVQRGTHEALMTERGPYRNLIAAE